MSMYSPCMHACLCAHADVIEHMRSQISSDFAVSDSHLWPVWPIYRPPALVGRPGRSSGKLGCCWGEPCPVWAAGQYFGCREGFPRLSPKRQFPE